MSVLIAQTNSPYSGIKPLKLTFYGNFKIATYFKPYAIER